MSSQNRGAQGTNKQKGVSVNNLFSGRAAPGQRGNDPSRNGMQSVGKAANVFRRMPPPASLPSLRAENNGQDPTTPVVPQGGTGWSKSDNPNGAAETPQTPTTQPVAVAPPQPTNDLRPSWLVAANAEQQANNSQAREFPSLAPPLHESDKINKWDPSLSSLADKYHDMSNGDHFEGGVPSRFLGSNINSSDSFNAKSVAKPISSSKYNRISDDEGFDSQDRDRNYSPEEGGWSSNGSPSQTDSYGPDKDTDMDYRSYMRNDGPQYRTNEIRILRRATEQLLLQDISDDEDEVQMTRLDKPSVCIVKRGGENKSLDTPESERSEQGLEAITRSPTPPPPVKAEKKEKKTRKDQKSFKKDIKDLRDNGDDSSDPKQVENVWDVKKNKMNNEFKNKKKQVVDIKDDLKEKQTIAPPNAGPAPAPAPINSESPPPTEKPLVEEMLPAPLPQENVWAKRKEERESLEREKEKSMMPRVMQQAIEQHFPKVHDSATIKVNKESTRKSSDTEFTRAAIRARKQAMSNDVRRLINTENGPKIKLHRHGNGNQDQDDNDSKSNKGYGQNGYQNGYKGQNGNNRNNQNNGKTSESHNRERKDSHRSTVSSHHSEDNKKPVNGQNKKGDGKTKENGDIKKFNIEDMKDVNIESWADEMENLDGFEEVKSKNNKKNKIPEKSPSIKNQPTENQEADKNGKAKPKDPKQGTRLFVPKALRKETDDLPANGLLSPQSVETKEKIAAAKSTTDVPKKPEEDSKGCWDALTPEVATIPKKAQPPKKKGEVEFPKPIGKSVDITGYDFTFDPRLHQTPIMSDRAAIQKMLTAENEATDDGSNNRRKVLTDLRQSIDGMGQFAMPAKQVQDCNELFTCRPNNANNNNNITLAPFSNHYSSFQPLFNTDATLLYPNAAPSPPMSYLNMMNFSNMKRQNGYGSPENGLLGRMPNQQAAAAAAAVAAQHQRIWNGGHFDINSLAGTPPANYSSNGSYGFFSNCQNTNEMNKPMCLQHRPPFGGLPNGLSNGQAPFFDRTTLPPANLAVGSQRQGNVFNSNMNRPQQPPPQSGPSHPMGGMNNSSGPFPPPPQSFPQPPPNMMRMPPPTNGGSHQDNVAFFFNGNRGPIGRPPGLSASIGHSAQPDMIWSNSNSNYFGNAGHSNGNWNGGQAAGPPRQNSYNIRQARDNQQMNNRMRPTPVQGTRQ